MLLAGIAVPEHTEMLAGGEITGIAETFTVIEFVEVHPGVMPVTV